METMTPAAVGLLLSLIVAVVGVVRWFVSIGRGIQRIEDKIERLTGLELLVVDARDRIARLEGAQAHKPNGALAGH